MPHPRHLAVPLLAFGLGFGLAAALAWFPRHLLRSRLPDLHLGGPDAGDAVAVAGKRLTGVEHNISGLTYNPNSNTLFAVINRPEQVAEPNLFYRFAPVGTAGSGRRHVVSDPGSASPSC